MILIQKRIKISCFYFQYFKHSTFCWYLRFIRSIFLQLWNIKILEIIYQPLRYNNRCKLFKNKLKYHFNFF
ncbi:unnamed protein product [Paramecium pentaurelia]|uniref:Uncharacterized protein n=1 Tax=Paramecium pentaurelia TaxID=43138 RepID=A0A8S1YIC3_9CILI|nr:unnamed protein product [Paramecium pentaurelia]